MSKMDELVETLAEKLELPLHLNEKQSCCMIFEEILPVYIEQKKEEEKLILAATLAELPAGKFREDVLTQALKENHRFHQSLGILGFNIFHNELSLFQEFALQDLTEQKLFDILNAFVQKALSWKRALEKGNSCP